MLIQQIIDFEKEPALDSSNEKFPAGLAQPGKIERGLRASACKKHLHQLHVCLPAGVGRTRLLYRMSMDFMAWTKAVPFIDRFWASIANQVHNGHELRVLGLFKMEA